MLGENLTITGLLEANAYVGDVLKFPDCTVAISEPRRPCYKFRSGDGVQTGRQDDGAIRLLRRLYLAVREPGTLAAGESFELIPGQREVSDCRAVSRQDAPRLRHTNTPVNRRHPSAPYGAWPRPASGARRRCF